MTRTCLLGLLIFSSLSAQDRRSVPAPDARRLALVIGNQNYASNPSRRPGSDARAMAALLKDGLNFDDVDFVEDATYRRMSDASGAFLRKVHPGDVVFFYYSGRAARMDGINWLVPVDFRGSANDMRSGGIDAERLLVQLERSVSAVRIFFLDAALQGPLLNS